MEPTDPRVPMVESRADEAMAMFEELERRRKADAQARVDTGAPRIVPPTTPNFNIPGQAPVNQEVAKPVNQLPITPTETPDSDREAVRKLVHDSGASWGDDLQTIQSAIEAGKFDVAQKAAEYVDEHGATLPPDVLAKFRAAYFYDQRMKSFSPIRAAKAAVTGTIDTTKELMKAFLWELPKSAVVSEKALRKMAAAKAAGDEEGFQKAKGEILKQYLEFETGAEVGNFGAADLGRRAFRKHFIDKPKAALENVAEGNVLQKTKAVLGQIPVAGAASDLAFELAGVKDTPTTDTPEDLDEQMWADIGVAQQLAKVSQGEGAYLEQASGATAKDIAETAGVELSQPAINAWATVNNPYIGIGPAANLVRRFGLRGAAAPIPRIRPRPRPTGPTPKPRTGGAMAALGTAMEEGGSGTLRHLAGGGAMFGAISGNPLAALASAIAPSIIRRTGRAIRNRGQAVARGEATVIPVPKLVGAIKEHVLKPYFEGAKETLVHPTTLGLAAFTEDDTDLGHVLGGAAGFGGVLNVGARGVPAAARGTHAFLARDLVNQNKVRIEPFDPNYGQFAETTGRNLAEMSQGDQAIVNMLRNNIRQTVVSEPDVAAIKNTPPRMGAKEWITGERIGADGTVGYETNLGRHLPPATAARVAWEAGQPLRDVTYNVEVIVGGPHDSANPQLRETFGENVQGNRGFADLRRGQGDQAGQAYVWLNRDSFAGYHEATHVLDWARHPAKRAQARRDILRTYGENTVEGFRRVYAEMLAAREINRLRTLRENATPREQAAIDAEISRIEAHGGWGPDATIPPLDPGSEHILSEAGRGRYNVRDGEGNVRQVSGEEAVMIAKKQGQVMVDEALALDEAAAEMGNLVLKTRSLQGVPDSMRQIAARNALIFLEATGAVKPGLNVRDGLTPADEPGSSLGFEYSAMADMAFWNELVAAAGQQVPGAPVTAPTGPRFFDAAGTEGSASQRVAGRSLMGDEPAPADLPVAPAPPAAPGTTPTSRGPGVILRPGIVDIDGDGGDGKVNRAVIDTTKATEAEVNTVLQRLREAGLPEAELARLEPILRAKGNAVEITYASATPDGVAPSELAWQRRAELKATYEREQGAVNQELRDMAPETRTKFQKSLVPNRVIVRTAKDGQIQANVLGLSTDKILQNAIILDSTIRNINAKLPADQKMILPFQEPGRTGRLRFNYEAMWDGLVKYTENQSNGYTGEGNPLQTPRDFIEVVPEVNPDFTPHKLSPVEAGFFNMLMGVEPPVSTKATGRKGALVDGRVRAIATGERVSSGVEQVDIQPKAVSAFQLSEANAPGRGIPSPTRQTGATGPRVKPAQPWEVSVPSTAMRKGVPATQVKKGTFRDPRTGVEFDIQEFNRIRAEITEKARATGKKDFNLQDYLAEAFEELNVELIDNVKPTKQGRGVRYPSETMIEAGFMPEADAAFRQKITEARRMKKGESMEDYVARSTVPSPSDKRVVPVEPVSEAGKAYVDAGMKLRGYETEGGYGVLEFKDGRGERAGYIGYHVDPLGTGWNAHVTYVETALPLRGQKVAADTSVAGALYRELAANLRDRGVKQISGDPISERAMALRMKVFEDTAVTDYVDQGRVVVDPANLRKAIDDAGGLLPFMQEQGMFELTSYLRQEARYMPDNVEAPVMATVRDQRTGKTYDGPMHLFAYMNARQALEAAGETFVGRTWDEGFKTNKRDFVTRDEAAELANKALGEEGEQIKGGLLSEELATTKEAMRRTKEQGVEKPGATMQELKAAMEKNYGDVLAERRAMPEVEQRKAAEEDFKLEQKFANEFLADRVQLEDFPYYDDYVKTVDAEAASLPKEPGSILMIGSGPVPLTAILLGKRFPNAALKIADIDATALAVGKGVMDQARVPATTEKMDATKDFGPENADTIVVALEAGPDNALKAKVVENVLNRAPSDATILLRSSKGSEMAQVGDIEGSGWTVTDRIPTFGEYGETLVVRSSEARAMPEARKMSLSDKATDPEFRKQSLEHGIKSFRSISESNQNLADMEARSRNHKAAADYQREADKYRRKADMWEADLQELLANPAERTIDVGSEVTTDRPAALLGEGRESAFMPNEVVKRLADKGLLARDASGSLRDPTFGRVWVSPDGDLFSANALGNGHESWAMDYIVGGVADKLTPGVLPGARDLVATTMAKGKGWTPAWIETSSASRGIFVEGKLNKAQTAALEDLAFRRQLPVYDRRKGRELLASTPKIRIASTEKFEKPIDIREGRAMPGEWKPKGWEKRIEKAKEKEGMEAIHWWTPKGRAFTYDAKKPSFMSREDTMNVGPESPHAVFDFSDGEIRIFNADSFTKRHLQDSMPEIIEALKAMSKETGLPLVKPNGEAFTGELAEKLYDARKLKPEEARREFESFVNEEPPVPDPTFVGEGKIVKDSEIGSSPAWLLRNGKSKQVDTHDIYHDDMVHGFQEFNRPENKRVLGERSVAAFQADTGAVRLAVFESGRQLADYGNGTLGISMARKPTESQLSAILARLRDRAGYPDTEPLFSRVSAGFQNRDGSPIAAMSRNLDTPADIRAVMQFLRDPFSFPDAEFIKGAPAENTASPRFMPEDLAAREKSGQLFKKFFSDVTKGDFGKSDVPFVPVLNVAKNEKFMDTYAKHRGNFDEHIAKSIPTYMEVQIKKGDALSQILPEGARVLDIGASEGSLMKAISERSGAKTVSLDPNPDMARFFRTKSQVEGAEYVEEAFLRGFEDEGKIVPAYNTKDKFQVIHEAMAFQFISPERAAHVAEMKRLLAEDGMVLLEEKVRAEDPETWRANEELKDSQWKDRYFTKEELAEKDKTVGFQQSKQETKAVGMVDNMVTRAELESILRDNFKSVAQYWDSGNFKGYVASDNPRVVENFLNKFGEVNSEFSTETMPRKVTTKSPEESRFMPDNFGPEERFALRKEDVGVEAEEAIRGNHWVSPEGLFYRAPDHRAWAQERVTLSEGKRDVYEKSQMRRGRIHAAEYENVLKRAGWTRISWGREDSRATVYLDGIKPSEQVREAIDRWAEKNPDVEVVDSRDLFGRESAFMPEAVKKGQKDLELKHYSNVPGIKVLDPNRQGSGRLGAERTRRRDHPEIYIPRTYFGMKGYKKEAGLGPYTYEAVVKSNRVYDYLRDPDDLYPSSPELKEAGFAPFDESAAITLYERNIADAGYDGFKNTDAKVAALFKPTKVKQVSDTRAMPDQDMFGAARYNGKAIQSMTSRDLRTHFPEAIVLRGRKKKPINNEIEKAPLLKGAKTSEEKVNRYKEKLVEFYNSVKDRPEVQAGKKWYSEFTPELKKQFGEDAPIFAELLAATSPNTNPEVNFGYSADVFFNWKAGKYTKQVDTFVDGLQQVDSGSWRKTYDDAVKAGAKRTGQGEPTEAEFMAWWIESNKLQPRGSGGKLIGMHSTRVLQVLAREWLARSKGPKTRNFVENLLGTGHEATIDVWAARTMRRLGYEGYKDRWRILPENSTGVTDPDFYFSQEAFKAAAKELGMRPDSLQGALWFAEKQLWADQGWGRLDFGDFRAELKKLDLLKSRFAESQRVQERTEGLKTAAQEDLF